MPRTSSSVESRRRTGKKGLLLVGPDLRLDLDSLRRDLDRVNSRRTPAAGAVGDRARRAHHGAELRVLDVIDGFLVIMSAQHEIDTEIDERPRGAGGAREPVPVRDVATQRIVMHHEHAKIVRGRGAELRARLLDLRGTE